MHITWDLARAQAVLQAELDRITLPTEPVTSLTLPRYPVKEGIDPSQVDYSKYDNFNTWATVTWTSANDQIVKVGSAPYTPYYAPYATTLTRTAADQQVTLTASIVCNSIEGLTLTKAFTVTVAASQESQASAARAASGQARRGLCRLWRPARCRDRRGPGGARRQVHRRQRHPLPEHARFRRGRQVYPGHHPSSDADTIVPPGVNNAARVEVYRPLPGEDAKDVTVTVTIRIRRPASPSRAILSSPSSRSRSRRSMTSSRSWPRSRRITLTASATAIPIPSTLPASLHAFREGVSGRRRPARLGVRH
ncbi:MAG: hypothetical protein ACLR1P_03460 [Oscillospiraceae bacterium]